MADLSANGNASADLTPAQRLMQLHKTDHVTPHPVEIEEVVDQDDLEHPPPSASLSSASQPVTAKVAGKQAQSKQPSAPRIDTQSDEAFPALGGPTPRTAAATPTTWSAKPARLTTHRDNGSGHGNGNSNGISNGGNHFTSGASTPSSETTNTPVLGRGMAGRAPSAMALPGRHTERVQFAPSQLTPRNQLKKPVQDVLRDINKRSKARIDMTTGSGGVVIFEGTGPVEAVRQSLKEVAKELGSKQSVKIPIPVSVKGNIIGRQGSTIQNISKRTGARIQMAKQDPDAVLEDDATVDVLIEGDAISAEMARREIEAIVNEHTSSVNMRIRNVPAEYYPFLAGRHKSRSHDHVKIHIPHYHTWVDEAPAPAPAGRQPAGFSTQAPQPISIAGDRLAAAEARSIIEQQVEQLRQQLTVDQMAIEKARHQFIFGDKEASLEDFMTETGCAVIFPPDGHDSEVVTIIGPPERLEEGMNKIMDLASSMHMANVDIARQHANAPRGAHTHARHINRYLHHRKAISELERMHDARIMAQTAADAPSAWEVYSRDAKNAMRARSDIMNLVSAHPPSRFAPVTVDPFFHDMLRKKAPKHVREKHGVHVVIPGDVDDEAEVLLVFEGPTTAEDYQVPRRQPSGPEVQQFGPALQDARAFIESLVGSQDGIVVQEIEAPPKFHDKIRRHVAKQQHGLPADQLPVQVRVGGRHHGHHHKRAHKPSSVTMRGPQDDVAELVQNLMQFIEQEERDELERGFTLSFDFPQKFANQLIGKSGANIKKLREEFDVDIRVQDGKVELQGPEAKANACKSHIMALARKLEDEATHVLRVKPQYHKDMIGAKGAQVNRLQDRYKVRINFPRSAVSTHDADEADGEQRQRNQAPDEVIIRGPRRGADEARDELISLLQYTMDTSHSATVSVAQSQVPKLIGAGGRELDALRATTGAQIDVPNKDEVDDDDRAHIKIRGTKKQVDEAKNMIEKSAREFDAMISRSIEIDKKHHRTIIGPGGATLRDIAVKAGGPDDRQQLARMVRFPKAEAEGNIIRLEGSEDVLTKIIEQIEAIVSEKEDQITKVIDVAPEKHRLLIGRGGETRRRIESDFGVSVDIPRQTTTGHERSHIKVIGRPENVEKALAHIESVVKDKEGQTARVMVPKKHHQTVADNGQFFRRLRNDHHVSVNHDGVTPPPKKQHRHASHARRTGKSLPLITDDAGSQADNFAWEMLGLHAEDEEGEIPWVLSGSSQDEVAKAQSKLEAALTEALEHDTAGYLIVPDPSTYGMIIGPGGAGINKIRKATKTKINVPKSQDHGEAIEIMGSQAGCEAAKDMIVAVIMADAN